jgi:hypothetical protein
MSWQCWALRGEARRGKAGVFGEVMQVKITSKEVVEACREWLEKYYGIKAGDKGYLSATATYDMRPGDNKPVKEIEVHFADAPKPTGGPYRT